MAESKYLDDTRASREAYAAGMAAANARHDEAVRAVEARYAGPLKELRDAREGAQNALDEDAVIHNLTPDDRRAAKSILVRAEMKARDLNWQKRKEVEPLEKKLRAETAPLKAALAEATEIARLRMMESNARGNSVSPSELAARRQKKE